MRLSQQVKKPGMKITVRGRVWVYLRLHRFLPGYPYYTRYT
jgi:hypothetical protein